MNRLVIIGNGFDLAHGLRTKYSDFLIGYIKSCFVKAKESGYFEDSLIKIIQRHSNGRRQIEEYTDLKDFLLWTI